MLHDGSLQRARNALQVAKAAGEQARAPGASSRRISPQLGAQMALYADEHNVAGKCITSLMRVVEMFASRKWMYAAENPLDVDGRELAEDSARCEDVVKVKCCAKQCCSKVSIKAVTDLRRRFRDGRDGEKRKEEARVLYNLVHHHDCCNAACAAVVGQSSMGRPRMARVRASKSEEEATGQHGLRGKLPCNYNATEREAIQEFLYLTTRYSPTSSTRYIIPQNGLSACGVGGLYKDFIKDVERPLALATFRRMLLGKLASEGTLHLGNADSGHNVCPLCKAILDARNEAALVLNEATMDYTVADAAANAADVYLRELQAGLVNAATAHAELPSFKVRPTRFHIYIHLERFRLLTRVVRLARRGCARSQGRTRRLLLSLLLCHLYYPLTCSTRRLKCRSPSETGSWRLPAHGCRGRAKVPC